MKAFIAKQFKANLNNIVKADGTMRDRVQQVIEMGLSHYALEQDTCHLTTLMSTINSCRSIRGATVQEYIQANANVTWRKITTKKGVITHVFKKVGKDIHVNEAQVLAKPWYEFNKDGLAKPELDIMTRIKSLVTQIGTAQDEDRLKSNPKNEEILTALNTILA